MPIKRAQRRRGYLPIDPTGCRKGAPEQARRPAGLTLSGPGTLGVPRPLFSEGDLVRVGPLKAVVANLVASTDLPIEFDVWRLSKELGFYHDVEWTHFGVHALSRGLGKVLVYRSGRVVLAGTNGLASLAAAGREFLAELAGLGYRVGGPPLWRLDNVVAVIQLPNKIILEQLSDNETETVEYNSEVFPGAIIRARSGRVTVLAFTSGKLVITGARSYGKVRSGLVAAMTLATLAAGPRVDRVG